MSNVLSFNTTDFKITAIIINDEPWFSGKQVATILGYSNTNQAIKNHVREKHKHQYNHKELTDIIGKNYKGHETRPLKIPPYGATLINESGLYSLILKSKLKKAEKFPVGYQTDPFDKNIAYKHRIKSMIFYALRSGEPLDTENIRIIVKKYTNLHKTMQKFIISSGYILSLVVE